MVLGSILAQLFNDFSYVTRSYNDIMNALGTFDEYEEISVSTDYYLPDESGYFHITDEEDKPLYTIVKPQLLDSKFTPITDDTIHTLKDNGDNTYQYRKYISNNLYVDGVPNSIRYIDATTLLTDSLYDINLKSNESETVQKVRIQFGLENKIVTYFLYFAFVFLSDYIMYIFDLLKDPNVFHKF